MVIQVGEALFLILYLCLNVSVYSKSTYNVVEFIIPKKLLYLQYAIIDIFNIGFFIKMLPSQVIWILVVFFW